MISNGTPKGNLKCLLAVQSGQIESGQGDLVYSPIWELTSPHTLLLPFSFFEPFHYRVSHVAQWWQKSKDKRTTRSVSNMGHGFVFQRRFTSHRQFYAAFEDGFLEPLSRSSSKSRRAVSISYRGGISVISLASVLDASGDTSIRNHDAVSSHTKPRMIFS